MTPSGPWIFPGKLSAATGGAGPARIPVTSAKREKELSFFPATLSSLPDFFPGSLVPPAVTLLANPDDADEGPEFYFLLLEKQKRSAIRGLFINARRPSSVFRARSRALGDKR